MFIQTHELWHLLHEKAEAQDRNIASDFESEVIKICEYGINLAKTIRDNFKTYTLHDEIHISNVMTNILMLLGDSKDRLTRDECAILLMCACCHDIGMSITEEEKEFLRSCPDCMQIYLNNNDQDYIAAYGNIDNETINITDEIIQHYVRANHHKRVYDKMQKYIAQHDNIWPISLGSSISMHDLCQVCQSHGENIERIKHLQHFSPDLDLQFCAILLRLGDILDFDTTRAPDSLYQYINLSQLDGNENKKSRNEWEKHQESHGFTILEDAHQIPILLYKADCTSIETERAIISYLIWVEEELTDCWELIPYLETRWRDFRLPNKIKHTITVNGYLSGEYKLTLDQEQVLELLTGQAIYEDPAIFVRELIQNAIDAIRTRKQLDKHLPKNWQPQIKIRTWMDQDGAHWFCIEDNGMGMTEQMLRECFLKVGRSYYRSSQFQADRIRSQSSRDYWPISHFGIGLLSCFMGGSNDNRIEVTTRHFPESHTPYPAYRLSMKGTSGYYHLSNSFDHQITAPKMPNSSIHFIDKPGTIIAVKIGLLQSSSMHSFWKIIEKYVVYPEIPIVYEAEEMNQTYEYPSEVKFLEDIYNAVPKPEDGIYRPIMQDDICDEAFQQIQERYPEISWEERPRIEFYCLPLDYFSCSPLITGATIIAKAGGKGVWRAECLDEKYIPTINLRLSPVWAGKYKFLQKMPQFIIEPQIRYEDKISLKKRILPNIRSFVLESGININLSPYTFSEVLPSISLKGKSRIPDVTDEEFRVFQAISNGSHYTSKPKNDTFEHFPIYDSWFKQYFDTRHFITEGNLSTNAHNGVLSDYSQLLVFGTSVVSTTICILKDRYCPTFNLARSYIRELPLETICHLDAITDRIMNCIGVYNVRFDDRNFEYCYRDRMITAPLREYDEIFSRSPELLSNLHFLTDLGIETISSLKAKLDKNKKIYINIRQTRPIHQAALMLNFNLTVSFLGLDNEQSVFITKRTISRVPEIYLDFPPALFLPSSQNDSSILSCCDKYTYRSFAPYNEAHPFSAWLMNNHTELQAKAPDIYFTLIGILTQGLDIIERIDECLHQLHNIPKLGVKIFRDLSADDFLKNPSDLDYWL